MHHHKIIKNRYKYVQLANGLVEEITNRQSNIIEELSDKTFFSKY